MTYVCTPMTITVLVKSRVYVTCTNVPILYPLLQGVSYDHGCGRLCIDNVIATTRLSIM